MPAEHKMLNGKSKAKQQIVNLSTAVTFRHYMPSKCQTQISEHLAQHITGQSKFCQKLSLAL